MKIQRFLTCVGRCGGFGLVYWGLTPQQQPGSYQGGEMMMMKSVFWWRKPEYPEECGCGGRSDDPGERHFSVTTLAMVVGVRGRE